MYFIFLGMIELFDFVMSILATFVTMFILTQFKMGNVSTTIIFRVVVETLFGVVTRSLVRTRLSLEVSQVDLEIHSIRLY